MRAGVPVERCSSRTRAGGRRKQNAYVSGFGRTRRLVLFDTLLEAATRRGAAGRSRTSSGTGGRGTSSRERCSASRDVLVVVLFWAVLQWRELLDALDVSGPGDPRVVPFVLLFGTLLQLLGLPFGSALSRRWEREADRIAVELTSDPGAFERMMRRLALANLADLDPPRLVYLMRFSHPTPPERIAAARRLA